MGFGYLRATRVVRLIVFAMNLMLRLRRKPVLAFFRPGDAIQRIAAENGLASHAAHDVGHAWKIAVFRRK
ncbi:MAG TPA: hypothetical protein VFP27_01710 [Mycobacterium sp.]|nr:hypothetical protein [Mycobacterium sp.]